MSHQPLAWQALVTKKLVLCEKQLRHREKQIDRLQRAYAEAQERIVELQRELQESHTERAAAQEDWEEEKAALLRFRGAGGLSGMKLHPAGGARMNQLKERDQQMQNELRMQLLKGAAEVQELLDAGIDTSGLSTTSGGRFRVTLKKFRLFLRRKLYPFATDVRQIEARFGYSVASYFRFFRWIIMSFIAISIPSLVFLVLHILFMTTQVCGHRLLWSHRGCTELTCVMLSE